jgi:hypothetical protein
MTDPVNVHGQRTSSSVPIMMTTISSAAQVSMGSG